MYEKYPPRLAERLLRWATERADRDCVAGDLTEEFAARALRSGLGGARRWHWWQVMRSVPTSLLTGRSVSIGAIYATLRRLERKGLVTSHLGEPTAERGGRAKRFFGLEPAGAVAVARSRAMFARLWDDLPETH